MILTKMGKCVVCRVKVKIKREFQPQIDMFRSLPTVGFPKEMADRIKEWRDKPLLCENCEGEYDVKKVAAC